MFGIENCGMCGLLQLFMALHRSIVVLYGLSMVFKGLFYKTKYRFEWSLIAFFAVIDKESFVVAKDIDNCQGKFSGFLNRMISYQTSVLCATVPSIFYELKVNDFRASFYS